jgi:hypothetical protein
VFHYVPLDRSPMGKTYGLFDCPQTQMVADTLLRLPLYNDLSVDQQAEIVEAIQEFSESSQDLARLALAVAEPATEHEPNLALPRSRF